MSRSESIKYSGGLFVLGAPLSRPPGACLIASNYEIPLSGGYRRVDGYALYDGSTSPAAVPGSGVIRGLHIFGSNRYAFRDNAGGTACVMYKATTSGWTKVNLGGYVKFDVGQNEISVGDTVLGATSGASAVVTYIVVQSGDWSTNDAAGYVHYTTVSGGPFINNEFLTVSAVNMARANGANAANTLPAGGFYEFVNTNFYGSSGTVAMYGCNGMGNAFTFDGTNFAFIYTGMTTDTPNHIAEFKKHLFLSFPGGSVQHSSIGSPLEWSAVTGAAEIAVGDDVTGLSVEVGDILVIASRNKIHLLRGTSASDWNLQVFSSESGVIEKTMQRIGQTTYLDDRGLIRLSAAQEYGDFASAAFSANFEPILEGYLAHGVKCSCILREKGQYRIFFGNNKALICTFDNKFLGATALDYDVTVEAVTSGEVAGVEYAYFGDEDGNVYQMDTGTSFNGEEILSLLRPQYYHHKTPARWKRFRRLLIEAEATSNVTFSIIPDFTYSDEDVPRAVTEDYSMYGGAGYWEVSAFESFNWSVPVSPSLPARIDGIGVNMSPLFYHSSSTEESFTLYGHVVEYDMRGGVR